eukprot:scaffold51141_cov39-Tisochrysis_lutea.AAC.2
MDRTDWVVVSSGSTTDNRVLELIRKLEADRTEPIGWCTFGALGGATRSSSRNLSSELHTRSQRSLDDIGKLLIARSANDKDPSAAVLFGSESRCLPRKKPKSTVPRSIMALDNKMGIVANTAANVSIAIIRTLLASPEHQSVAG